MATRKKPGKRSGNKTEAARTALGKASRGYTATYYTSDEDTIGTELPIQWRVTNADTHLSVR